MTEQAAVSNAEIVSAYLDAVLRRDATVIDRFFHPDVEYIVNGTSQRDAEARLPPLSADLERALPWMGLHRGRQAVKAFFSRMHQNLDVTAYGPREVISEGNRAAAFGWFRLRSLVTATTVDIAYAIRFELRDGLIVKYHFLENTFDVAYSFRAGSPWQIQTDGVIHQLPTSR